MTDDYDPSTYWTAAPPMAVRPAHADQQLALLGAMKDIQPNSILEIGVGSGRIGGVLCGYWPDAEYTGIDISADRIAEARRALPDRAELIQADLLDWEPDHWYDLVIAVEVLMHVRPSDLSYAIERLRLWSRQHIVTVDWTEPIDGPIAPWNFLHDYPGHGLKAVATTGKQSIHRRDWW